MQSYSKPVTLPTENVIWKSVISMIAFFIVYYLVFDQNLYSAIGIVLVLLIHEAGHYLAMKQYGYKDVKMLFVPLLGAYVVGEKEKLSQKQELVVVLAGPIPGILIGILLNIAGAMTGYSQLENFANIFVYLNAFNLIPVLPMDGGRLVETLFAGSKEIVQSIFLIISILLVPVIAYYTESYFILILLLLLFSRLNLLWKTRELRNELKSRNIEFSKSYSELSNEEYNEIRSVVIQKMPELKKSGNTEESIMNVVKGILIKWTEKRISIIAKILVCVLWLLFLICIPILNLIITTWFF